MSTKKIEYLSIEEAKMRGKKHILQEADVLRRELQKSKRNMEIYA